MNNIKIMLGIGGMFFSLFLWGQQEDARVYLHDKPDSTYYYNHPLQMLSQRALDRRQRYGIALDIRDVPLYAPYLDSLARRDSIQILARSKWLNAVHVRGPLDSLRRLADLPFVDSVVFADRQIPTAARFPHHHKWENLRLQRLASYHYGDDTIPDHLHHMRILHDSGIAGQGVLIAIIDAGFPQADTAHVFQHIYNRNGVIDTYNFPDDTSFVYTRHYHGTIVWSVIGGLDDGALVGMAPDADYCLYISEDVGQEMPVEESWWAMAAERADSVGTDVINTSLGYVDFDRPAYNHTADQLGKNEAFVSRAAQIAVEKGIHVVVAAGNWGNSSWQKVGFPADAPGVIAVGAVDADSIRASFSSRGPDALGRIKPDVMSWGQDVKCYFDGQYYHFSGTSLAAPVITGLTADMVQAFPLVNPADMKQYILEASDRYASPDNLYGYGIPDFGSLYVRLTGQSQQGERLRIYPNPFTDALHIRGLLQPVHYLVYNLQGKIVKKGKTYGEIHLPELSAGTYWLYLWRKNFRFPVKIIREAH